MVNPFGFAAGLLAALAVLVADWRRRRLVHDLRRVALLVLLDVLAPAGALGYAAGRLGCLISQDELCRVLSGSPEGRTLLVLEFLAGVGIFYFLWSEGRRSMQWQRPQGLVTGEFLILGATAALLFEFLRNRLASGLPTGTATWPGALGWLALVGGGVLVTVTVQRFLKQKEEHRIVRDVNQKGDSVQPEYTPASPECSHPERWKMYDTMTAEVEVLQFLKALMTTVKPNLVVETGSFMGISTLWIAEGLKQNGFGKVITCEYDPVVFAKARQRLDASGLGSWIEYRNESSLEMKVEGTIDIFFSDSDLPIREQEVRRFLPQISPHGLILMHDAGSHYKIVREGALRLENEGLVSVVLMPTPRGLVVAQKRAGRT
ncbi:MAG: prolipoprotein diacylglyceryl transferase family protein [Terriglobales bacterium]